MNTIRKNPTAVGSILFIFVLLLATSALTQEKPRKNFQFEGSKIEGEREKPKDLYIVPWQGTTLLEESSTDIDVFEGLDKENITDRYQFKNEIGYYGRTGVRPH